MSRLALHPATSLHRDAAIATLVLAFSADPAARWLYRDSEQFLCHFPSFVKAFAGRAFDRGTAYRVDGVSGVALWLPPGIPPDEASVFALLQQTAAREDQAEICGVFEKMAHYHPAEPHWYLPMIGVDPGHQHRGLGSALLGQVLRRCDRERKIAYLESSNAKNIPLYERHGFELLDSIQVGKSPPIFPMLRRPR